MSSPALFTVNLHYQPETIVKHELINNNVLKALLKNDSFVKTLDYPSDEQGFMRNKKYTLTSMLNNIKKNFNGKTVQCIYNQCSHKTGRFIVDKSAGLQMIERSIRHTLAEGLYRDFDFKNCHPEILVQLCKFNTWDCTNIEYYVNNRDICLESYSEAIAADKDTAKINILKILNGGVPVITADTNSNLNKKKEAVNNIEWYSGLKKEIAAIHDLIWKNYDQYAQIVKNKKKATNKLGSCFNHLITDIENQCMLALDDYFKINNFSPDVLCFDGYLI